MKRLVAIITAVLGLASFTTQLSAQPISIGMQKDSVVQIYSQLEPASTASASAFDFRVPDVYWAGIVGDLLFRLGPENKVAGFTWSSAVEPKQVRPFIEMLGKKFGHGTDQLSSGSAAPMEYRLVRNPKGGVTIRQFAAKSGSAASSATLATTGSSDGAIVYSWSGGRRVSYDRGVLTYSEGANVPSHTVTLETSR